MARAACTHDCLRCVLGLRQAEFKDLLRAHIFQPATRAFSVASEQCKSAARALEDQVRALSMWAVHCMLHTSACAHTIEQANCRRARQHSRTLARMSSLAHTRGNAHCCSRSYAHTCTRTSLLVAAHIRSYTSMHLHKSACACSHACSYPHTFALTGQCICTKASVFAHTLARSRIRSLAHLNV